MPFASIRNPRGISPRRHGLVVGVAGDVSRGRDDRVVAGVGRGSRQGLVHAGELATEQPDRYALYDVAAGFLSRQGRAAESAMVCLEMARLIARLAVPIE